MLDIKRHKFITLLGGAVAARDAFGRTASEMDRT